MNVEALTNMHRVLLQVERTPKLAEAFGLGSWAHAPAEQAALWCDKLADINEGAESSLELIPSCDTTACACGYAAMDPWFRRQGFTFEPCGNTDYDLRLVATDYHGITRVTEGWEAVETLFELNEEQAQELFSMSQYKWSDGEYMDEADITPRHVIDRIEAMLEGKHHMIYPTKPPGYDDE